MAITFVGSKTFNAAGVASGTFNVSLADLKDASGADATLLENDFVLINYVAAVETDAAYTPPSGYTEEAELYSDGTGRDTNQAIWRKFMGSSPDASVDIPNSGDAAGGVAGTIHAFRGVDTTTPLDVAAVPATGAGTARPDPAAITPVTAGAWIVVCGASAAATGAVFANPGDLSATTNHFRSAVQADDNDAMAGTGIKTDWVSGAFNPVSFGGGSTGTGGSWTADTLALRPFAAGGNVGLASETDTAVVLPGVLITTTGLSGETNTALALTPLQIGATGIAAETDAALGLGAGGVVGLAQEDDAGLALGGVHLRPAGEASETDAALQLPVVAVSPVGAANDNSAAFALVAVLIGAAARANENDTAFALAGSGGIDYPTSTRRTVSSPSVSRTAASGEGSRHVASR